MHSATYSPEDNKLRLYFSERIPKDEWERLKGFGFTWTMKQAEAGGCDMVAVWTYAREMVALGLCGEIDDEDQPMAERAADRAARFAGYLAKREGEAIEHADRYQAAPDVFGHQSEARAEREAKKAEREAVKAETQWNKAAYWKRRTSGVIAHALHLSAPDVRHRRIKILEAELRKLEADTTPREVFEGADVVLRYQGQKYVDLGHDCVGIFGQGRGKFAYSWNKSQGIKVSSSNMRTMEHLRMRIDYEKQMLEGQGGTMADMVEMIPGGFIGSMQIEKVTKDKSGLVSKVYLRGPHPYKEGVASLHAFSAERLPPGSYRAPTEEESREWSAKVKAVKDAAPKAPPLLNPTPEGARLLQAVFNEANIQRLRVKVETSGGASYWAEKLEEIQNHSPMETSQAWYSGRSTGEYAPCKTIDLAEDWTECTWRNKKPIAFRVRTAPAAMDYGPRRVVVLTDKPQKPLPPRVVSDVAA